MLGRRKESPSTSADKRVESYQRTRRFRLMCGLHVDERFESIKGSLVITQGCGKWLRLHRQRTISTTIPAQLGQQCRDMSRIANRVPAPGTRPPQDHTDPRVGFTEHRTEPPGEQRIDQTFADWAACLNDLADLMSATIEPLLGLAGRLSDQVLATSVTGPGLWTRDFDGQIGHLSFCDPFRLAESSGLNVIDSFPSRDLQGGGSGRDIDPLAHWLIFADRTEPLAHSSRVLIQLESSTKGTLLPASDGLDAELPQISLLSGIGLSLVERALLEMTDGDRSIDDHGQLAVQGRVVDELYEVWKGEVDRTINEAGDITQIVEEMFALAKSEASREGWAYQDVLRTAVRTVAYSAQQCVVRQAEIQPSVDTIIAAGRGIDNGLLLNEISQMLPEFQVIPSNDFQIDGGELASVTSAMLGLMHIDLMPSNVPSITGAEVPRILGRLTPGSPSNWRQLILEMADYRPPAMKLREAI